MMNGDGLYTLAALLEEVCDVPTGVPHGSHPRRNNTCGPTPPSLRVRCASRSAIHSAPSIPTVCPSVASRNLLLYQSLPSSIPYRHTILWRRKDDLGMGTTASGTVA